MPEQGQRQAGGQGDDYSVSVSATDNQQQAPVTYSNVPVNAAPPRAVSRTRAHEQTLSEQPVPPSLPGVPVADQGRPASASRLGSNGKPPVLAQDRKVWRQPISSAVLGSNLW